MRRKNLEEQRCPRWNFSSQLKQRARSLREAISSRDNRFQVWGGGRGGGGGKRGGKVEESGGEGVLRIGERGGKDTGELGLI